MNSSLQPGSSVIVVLHSPREKTWGVLDEIHSAGVFLRGLDLNAFEDWISSIVHNEPFIGFSDLFFPIWRIERVAGDEASGGVPSLYEQVQQRTGHSLEELIQRKIV